MIATRFQCDLGTGWNFDAAFHFFHAHHTVRHLGHMDLNHTGSIPLYPDQAI